MAREKEFIDILVPDIKNREELESYNAVRFAYNVVLTCFALAAVYGFISKQLKTSAEDYPASIAPLDFMHRYLANASFFLIYAVCLIGRKIYYQDDQYYKNLAMKEYLSHTGTTADQQIQILHETNEFIMETKWVDKYRPVLRPLLYGLYSMLEYQTNGIQGLVYSSVGIGIVEATESSLRPKV